MTEAQKERIQKHWEEMAQEPINIEEIGGVIYAFGSELACESNTK
jgi:hypothetical protein